MSRSNTSKYSILGDKPSSLSWYSRSMPTTSSRLLLNISIFFFVVGLSFTAGRYTTSSTSSTDSKSNIPLNSIDSIFIYNRTFAEGTVQTAHAWKELFPPENGFFSHPEIAPKRSTLAVYHVLHCLNGIREAYWKAHQFAVAGVKMNESDLPMMISPPHVRHCIDLLRQSLMCNPDLTMEEKDEEAGGVHGFGVQHRCKRWDELIEWTTAAQKKFE